MKHYLLPVFILLAGLGLSSCSIPSNSKPSGTMADLLPLTVGDLWTYHHQVFKDDGTILLDTTQDHLIRSQQMFQGTPTYEISVAGDTLRDLQIYISGTSLLRLTNINHVLLLKRILYYPSGIGKTIVISDSTIPTSQLETKVIMILRSDNESVTVPAGTFSCNHFDEYQLRGIAPALDTTPLFSIYLASGIGEIQEKDYALNSNHVQITRQWDQLVSYKLK